MLFNSYIFIFAFLPITLLGYFGLNKIKQNKLAKIYLCIMSLVFYAYFNLAYLGIIVSSIIVNFIGSKLLNRTNKKWKKKLIFIVLLLLNIGILVYYKYFDFILVNINSIFKSSFDMLNILLPLGISFFTFQQLSFIIDSYKNKEVIKYMFWDYALFVTFFPQLIAGPIVLHNEIVPQFENKENEKINAENMAKGIMAFAFGLAKKVLIADVFGNIVNIGFQDVNYLNTLTACITMFSYTIQIYFDFSGYCDMATGIALMFNIKLPINFNSPYKAITITDFWKRWHITLTRFFTQYVYIPLGGNRKGNIRTYINIFIIFLISGIWHGANYTFIVWGILHGIGNIITRIFKEKIEKQNVVLNWIITFIFINLTWVMFRANSVSEAILFYKKILCFNFSNMTILSDMINVFNFNIAEIKELYYSFPKIKSLFITYSVPMQAFMLFVLFAILGMKNTNERIETFKPNKRNVIIVSILLIVSIMSLSQVSTFLYFNF